MQLSQFILAQREAILADWEAFAATRGAAGASMDSVALRDHAEDLLEAIAADIATGQTRSEQFAKSVGNGNASATQTAAQAHAILRAREGFDINQMVAEYRALRASIVRRWFDQEGGPVAAGQEVMRFHEAIDQAIAESVSSFSAAVERSRNLLMGMLGHDLRSPLQTIQLTAQYLTLLPGDQRLSAAAARLVCAGTRMQALIEDLVDFNRAHLGLGLRIRPAPAELETHFQQEVDQLRTANPTRTIRLQTRGDTHGEWDAMRLRQLLANLVLNALRHGDADGEVQVVLSGDADGVHFDVSNPGPALAPAVMERMFEPLCSDSRPECRADGHSLGLGLYISREVARAHGGDIVVASAGGHTRFTVSLPRIAPTPMD